MRYKNKENQIPFAIKGREQERAHCPLCHHEGTVVYHNRRQFFCRCEVCGGIFAHRDTLPDRLSEQNRYREHNNDVNDPRYRQFVSPITDALTHEFTPAHRGLDFGAGPGPVISTILNEKGFSILQYDPFFAPDPSLLQNCYDYIVCCEVIEHFFYPDKDFRLLRTLLKPGGKLYCMTSLYSDDIDFSSWAYKNDYTHVFFYRKETLIWIKDNYDFADLFIDNKLSVFASPPSCTPSG